MPTRRTHSKSRNGCVGCKKRHVKCDEGHPTCGPCLKRKLKCHYLPVETDLSPSTPVGSTPPGSYPGGLQRELHQPDRTIELALFHHFSTVTYKTLKEDERSDHHLQVVIPRLALSHDYLLDTILALSALHTEYLDVCITRYWFHIALDYQHRALLAFNNALAHITSRNCEAIAVCSMLMIILVLAVPGVSQDDSPPDPASEILGLRNLLQGISHILCQSEETLRKGELGAWFQPIFEPKPKISRESQLTTLDSLDCGQASPEQVDLYRSLVRAYERLHRLIDNTGAQHRDVYKSACEALQESISKFPSDLSSIIGWPVKISPKILSLFEQEEPIAKLLFVHYGVTLELIGHRWFAKDAGKRLVSAFVPPFGTAEDKYVEILQWAKKSVGIQD